MVHIFNNVVGPWRIEGHERGIYLSFRLDISNSVAGRMLETFSTLLVDRKGDIFNSVAGKRCGECSTLWLEKCG